MIKNHTLASVNFFQYSVLVVRTHSTKSYQTHSFRMLQPTDSDKDKQKTKTGMKQASFASTMETFDDNCEIRSQPIAVKGKSLQGKDRFFTRGPHGSKLGIFSLGHVGVVIGTEIEDDTPWMDEHAVRIRAGIMNIFSWISFINIMFLKGPLIIANLIS